MREVGTPGSVGAWYVARAAEKAGHEVVWGDHAGCDAELVSVHHVSDYDALATLPRVAPVRILGGHPTVSHYRYLLPHCDYLCRGEGESWIVEALRALEFGGPWPDGTATLAKPDTAPVFERPLPPLEAYYNPMNNNWYLEIARGCPSKCHYCELGWGWPYRIRATEEVLSVMAALPRGRLHLLAPDEAAHPGYGEMLATAKARGLSVSFGSSRIRSVMRGGDIPHPRSMLIRVGLDGLSERVRDAVGKPCSDRDVVAYFRTMTERGHCNFKVFMIFGYPFETMGDFDSFRRTMGAVLRLPRKVNAHLRMKFTPFIPNPITPLFSGGAVYDDSMRSAVDKWLADNKKPYRNPGWYVESDGIMSRASWEKQVELQART